MNHISREDAKTMVGDGWHKLIDRAYDAVDELRGGSPEERGLRALMGDDVVCVTIVKEKFAGLRIYTHPFVESLYDLLDLLEAESLRTCEFCGAPGSVDDSRDWLKTRCRDCAVNH